MRFFKKQLLYLVMTTATLCPSFCSEENRREEGQALFNAAEQGELSIIQQIILASPDYVNMNRYLPAGISETPLSVAVEAGHTNVVRWLVEHGAKIRYGHQWLYGRAKTTSALHRAAARGHIEIVRYLVELCVDIGGADVQRRTPLYLAAEAGHVHVVRHLVEQGAPLNTRGPFDQTALFIAAIRWHVPIVAYLIKKGADLEIPNCWLITPLMELAAKYTFKTKAAIKSIMLLVQAGAYIDAHNRDRSVLSSATKEEPCNINDFLLAIYLLKRHAAVKQRELELLQRHYPVLFIAPSIFKDIQDDLLNALSTHNLPRDLESLLFKFLGIQYDR